MLNWKLVKSYYEAENHCMCSYAVSMIRGEVSRALAALYISRSSSTYHRERASTFSYHLYDTVTRLYQISRHFFPSWMMRGIRCLCFLCLLKLGIRWIANYFEIRFYIRSRNQYGCRWSKSGISVIKYRYCFLRANRQEIG